MYIHGEFRNKENDVIAVHIIKGDINTDVMVIGEDGLFFTDEPVIIEQENDDTWEHIITKSATINLITKNYLGDKLWADNARDVRVIITENTTPIFCGYVEPNTYQQPFTSPLDEFSINCLDGLASLKYYKYDDININTYAQKKSEASTVSFFDVIEKALTPIFNINDIELNRKHLFYDGSVAVEEGREKTLFQDLGIAEINFLCDEYDDVWSYEDVLKEILKYLNLHIIQHGNDIYLFNFDTIRKGTAAWIDLHHENDIRFECMKKIAMQSEMHSDTDTNITISDVFNQIKIKCNLEDKEDVITSPLDDDALTSPWSAKQLYMDEYIVSNTKGSGRQAFADMILGKGTEHEDAKTITWYMQMMQSNAWKLNTFHGKTLEEALPNSYISVSDRYVWQDEAPLYVKQNRLSPCIFRMGSAEGISKKDNSPTAKLDTNTYLYISINGNEKDTEADAVPTPQELENNADMIEYVGNASGGIFSPSDDDTTNYLVFSGSMLLQPIVKESGIYSALKKTLESNIENMYQIHTVDGEDGKKRLYTRKFHAMETPKNNTAYYYLQDKVSLQPWTKDKGTRLYKYQYTAKKDGTDRYSKLPVLECELIIGNKRLIEKDIDMYGNSTFEWVKIGEEPTTVDTDGNTGKITTFTLGINPKIDDYIIGQEYSLQNTVKYDMNLDAEGTAIPIKKSDALSGGIIFRILGPCNLVWNDVVRKHKTWFRRAKYKDNDRAILAHLENIIIKNFECKIYSDNGKIDAKKEQSDLIYISAENNKYINAKDDIEFKLITQPTSKECMEKGLKNTINMNAVINNTTSMPLSTLYNTITKEVAKAEEHYISQYYEEYSVPRICMETTLKSNVVEWRYLYSSSPLKKEFYPIKIVENVKAATSTITMKER